MAAKDTVVFEVKVTEKGLKVVQRDVETLGKTVESTSKATTKATKSGDAYNKQQKAIHQGNLSAAKSFSKLNQTMGSGSSGLVAAYATLAANIFAATAAFNALSRAASLEQLNAGLEFTGRAAGQNLSLVVDKLKEITGEAISTRDAMESVALGISAGFSEVQLEGITRVAKGASLALGRDMSDAMSRLTRGAAKLEPEILDELGIMVRLDEATATYAARLGKTADQLTVFERRMAFTNAIIEQGEKKFGAITEAIDPNPYDQLAASFKDLITSGTKLLNLVLTPLAGVLSKNVGLLAGAFVLLGKGVANQMLPALAESSKKAAENAKEMSNVAKSHISNLKVTGKVPKVFREVAASMKDGNVTMENYNRSLKSLDLSVNTHTAQLNTWVKEGVKTQQQLKEKKAALREVTEIRRDFVDAMSLQIRAQSQETLSTSLQHAAAGQYSSGLKLLNVAIKQNWQATTVAASRATILGKSYIFAAGALRTAGMAAKFFGTALLSALPIIGQVIMVASLLWAGIKKLIELKATPLTDELKEIAKRTKEYDKVATQFINSTKGMDTNLTVFKMNLSATNGIISQTNQSLQDLIATEEAMKLTKIEELRDRLRILQDLQKMEKEGAFEPGSLVNPHDIEYTTRLLEKLEASKGVLSDTARQAVVDNIKATLTNIQRMASTLDKGSAARERANRQISELNLLLKLASGGASGKYLERRLAQITSESNSLVSAFEAFPDLMAKTTELFAKAAKTSGPFADRIKLMSDVSAEFANQNKRDLPALTEEYQALFEAFGVSNIDDFNKQLKIIEQVNAVILSAKASLDTIKRDSEILTSLGGAEGKRLAAINEEAKLSELISAYRTQIKYTIEGTEDRQRAENDLAQALLESSKLRLTILTGEQEVLKENLSLQLSIANAIQQQASSALEIERAKAEIFGGGSISAAREAAFAKKEREAALNAAKEQAAIKNKILAVEFQLEALKFATLMAEANLTNEQKAIFIEQFKLQAKLFNMELKASEASLAALEARNAAASITGATNFSGLNTFDALGVSKDAFLGEDANLATRLEATANIASTLKSIYGELDPVLEAAVNSVGNLSNAYSALKQNLEDAATSEREGAARSAAVLQALGSTIGIAADLQQAASERRIAAIDAEIAAEQKRDGKSKESLARIAALEKKKEAMQKAAFEKNKKMRMAETVVNTVAAVVKAWADFGWPVGAVLGGLIAAAGAMQLSMIASQKYEGSGGGTVDSGNASLTIGKRGDSVDVAKSNMNSGGEIGYLRGNSGVGTNSSNFIPSATGGPIPRTRATAGFPVGENGPELFIPNVPGTIIPADKTGQAQTINASINITAMDGADVERVLLDQRGNLINMLREAANSNGETFMEEVNVMDYSPSGFRRV